MSIIPYHVNKYWETVEVEWTCSRIWKSFRYHVNSNVSITLTLIHLRTIIEKKIKRLPNPFADISRDSAKKNCRVAMENFQRKLTQSENDLKKGGKVAMVAGLKKNLLLALKKVAEQKCKGKLLRKRCGSYRVGARAGGGGGGNPTLFLDKLKPTEMRKNIFEAGPPFFWGSQWTGCPPTLRSESSPETEMFYSNPVEKSLDLKSPQMLVRVRFCLATLVQLCALIDSLIALLARNIALVS